MKIIKLIMPIFLLSLVAASAFSSPADEADKPSRKIELKAWGVPDNSLQGGPQGETAIKIVQAFQKLYPDITLVPTTGLTIPNRSMDTVPLMQIAGDIAPAVMSVNFRQSSTYISQKFLYPLDRYLEAESGTEVHDGHLMATEQYISALRKGPRYVEQLEERIPAQCWEVIRRDCPYGENCPYVKEWKGTVAEIHSHVWCLPQTQTVTALYYRKDLFAEAGLPARVPETMDEFLSWAREIHNPKDNIYGVNIPLRELGWSTLSFFYSCGARAVEKDSQGNWRCVFNSPYAVDAYYYVARLFLEPFENRYGKFVGVVNLSEKDTSIRYGMYFGYVGQRAFNQKLDPNTVNFGPVPKGPSGLRGSEFNSNMTGIYAGFENNIAVRDSAWKWMFFLGDFRPSERGYRCRNRPPSSA